MSLNKWEVIKGTFRASEGSEAGWSQIQKEGDNPRERQEVSVEATTPEMAREAATVLADHFNAKDLATKTPVGS